MAECRAADRLRVTAQDHHRRFSATARQPRISTLARCGQANRAYSHQSSPGNQVNRKTDWAEYERLSQVLRQLRLEAGLTQVEMAKRLEVPQSFVSKYESGTRHLDVIELRHIVTALGVPPGVVLNRIDPSWLRTT